MTISKRLLWMVVGLLGVTGWAADDPFLAIWREHEGHRLKSEAPYLRVAMWNDGRIVFAKDPRKWNHELLEGRVELERVEELKKPIEKTGVFNLTGTCYLVPSAPVDCIMLKFGSKQQMLYWDEVETANYGINISPKPHHLKFMSCWKEVNRLTLAGIPKLSQPHIDRFARPPDSWRLKKPIQSE